VFSQSGSVGRGSAHVTGVPRGIQSVPGSQVQSRSYEETLLQSNRLNAESALRHGRSEITTLVATPNKGTGSNFSAQRNPNAVLCPPCAAATTTTTAGLGAMGLGIADSPQASTSTSLDGAVNQLLAHGKINSTTAAFLRKLNASKLSPTQYKAAVDGLVKDGKLTSAEAKRLIAVRDQNEASMVPANAASSHVMPDALVAALQGSGAIDANTAQALKRLNASGFGTAVYASRLNALVQSGKLSPAAAQRLLSAYQKASGRVMRTTSSTKQPTTPSDLHGAGKVDAATAEQLRQLNAEGLTPEAYAKQLTTMVKAGKLSSGDAQALLAAYTKRQTAAAVAGGVASGASLTSDALVGKLLDAGSINGVTAQKLRALAEKNVTTQDYGTALQALVSQGAITPAEANQLLQAYQAQQDSRANQAQSGSLAALQAQQQQAGVANQEKQFAQEQQALTEKQQQAVQRQIAALEGNISSQTQQLLKAWQAPTQHLVGAFVPSSAVPTKEGGDKASAKGSKAKASAAAPRMIKAGDILFATLDTGINSDRPGPVMATIVAGKYKGAKLLGSLQMTSDHERVLLTFTRMSLPAWPATISINSVAINPDTARTALASDVDHHYLLRYSALFASSFLQGIGSAIQNSGQTTVNNSGTTSQTFSHLNTIDKVMVGFGQIGKSLGTAAHKVFARKPTVTVMPGVGLGILYTKDVSTPDFLLKTSEGQSSTEEQ